MAGGTADEVVGAGSLEGNGGGTAAVGADGISGGTTAVVARAHLIHGVAATVVEHCETAKSFRAVRKGTRKRKMKRVTWVFL